MISPISLSSNTVLVDKIPCGTVVDLYKRATGIDVSYLKNITQAIELYKCNDSGYFFYSPAAAAGNGLFYTELAKQPWYYSYSRWEHTMAIDLLPNKGELLEMGSGDGFFLKLVRTKKPGIKSIGLEINEKAIEIAKNEGLDLRNEDMTSFAMNNHGQFDVVCSFQVMEHIYNVNEVLKAQLAVLKTGGVLLIAVPNNDSFLGKNKHVSRCLNMPPHHMGLWDDNVFDFIEREFSVKKIGVYKEPFSIKDYNVIHYNHVLNKFRSELFVKGYFKLGLNRLFRGFFARRYKKNEVGHSVLAVFQK